MLNVKDIFSQDFKNKLLQEDLEKLTSSFRMLKETINEVSVEANSTANFLKENVEHTSILFLSIIDMIEDIVIIKDPENKWKILNKCGLDIFKLPYNELIGYSCLELAQNNPHLYETFFHCHETDEFAWESGIPFREIMSFDINDNILYFDIIKTPIYNIDGSRKELLVIGRNITDIKNENLRNKVCIDALNAASDNIFIFDYNGFIIFCNNHMLQEFKGISHSDIEGKHIDIISTENTSFEKTGEIWNSITNNIPWKGYIKLKSVNNELIEGQATILPVMNGGDHPSYFICMVKTKNYCRLITNTKTPACCNRPLKCLLVTPNSPCMTGQCAPNIREEKLQRKK